MEVNGPGRWSSGCEEILGRCKFESGHRIGHF